MGRNRTKAEQLDRATNTKTGEVATVMTVHTETTPKGAPPNYSVMLDTGPRRTHIWRGENVEWTARSGPRKCYRCGETDHTVVTCCYGDCGSHLTAEGRKAIEALGLDPRRIPGAVDAPDEYDGIRYWFDHAREGRAKMRRRVCEHDGHEDKDTCGCGEVRA